MKYSWLPPVLAEIADLAGLETALLIAEARGGQRVHIPTHADDQHWLVKTVGRIAADLICDRWTRLDVEIPRGPSGNAHKTAKRIQSMIDAGASSNEIARTTGVVFRTVTRHRAKVRRHNSAQGRLF